MAYFINRTRARTRTFRKVDPGPLEKDPIPKFNVLVKNSFK